MTSIPKTHMWTKLVMAALLGLVLIGSTEALSEMMSGPRGRGGGGRSGGGHQMRSGGHSNRGAVRNNSRGSVRHHGTSRGRSNAGRGSQTSRRNVNRSSTGRSHRSSNSSSRGASNRGTDAGRAAPGRGTAGSRGSSINRTPGHGSLRNSGKANNSLAGRMNRPGAGRGPGGGGPQSLRDIGGRPGDSPGPGVDGRPGHVPGHGPAGAHRRIHRRQLAHNARPYRWRNRHWWYSGGYWWLPYDDYDDYYDDYDDEYTDGFIQVYPEAGLSLTELPEGAVEVEGDDGGTYYEANGIYYEFVDGKYVVVEKPDSGMPDPITIVQRACDFLRKAPSFTLTATDTMDHVQDDGQKIQSETTRTIHLLRPNRLATTAKGDDTERSVWYDGKTLTIFDAFEDVFAKTPVPDTVDGMLDFTIEQLSVSLPLIDFLYADPFAGIQGALQTPQHLGMLDVNGVTCHHLSFTAGETDWQLWIDAGEDPLLTMLAITYNSVPESPTYRATFDDWNLDPELADPAFKAAVPSGTEEIAFVTPQAEVERLERALDTLRSDNARIADYIASTRSIELFSGIADTADGQAKIKTEQARLDAIGPVSQEEIDAYETKRKDLQAQLARARREGRSG